MNLDFAFLRCWISTVIDACAERTWPQILPWPLFVLPLIASPIIQLFWLAALVALFTNHWPGGRGPAWETGEAVPWPSAQERAAAANGDEPEPELLEAAADPEPKAPNPRASRKKKKKSRR